MLSKSVVRLLIALAALAGFPAVVQAATDAAQQTTQPLAAQPRQGAQVRQALSTTQPRTRRQIERDRIQRERRAIVAVPIWTGSAVEGAQTSYSRRVRSWSDMRFQGIVRQRTDFSCGAAALATIFNGAHGKRTSESQVLVNMFKIADPEVVKEKGFSLLDMKNYVRAIGMQGEGYSVPYTALQQLRVPGIVLMNVKGYKHFVVVRQATRDYVQLADPALGNRTISRRKFERDWNGVVFVVLSASYDPFNDLRQPPSPLAARRLFDHYSPIRNADVADFGIRSAIFRF